MISQHKSSSVTSSQRLLVAFCAAISTLILLMLKPSDIARVAAITGATPSKAEMRHITGGSCCEEDKNKLHQLAGSYYSLTDNFTAKLLLNNKGPEPIEIQLTLFSLNGERFQAPPVVVDGNTYRFVDLADWVVIAGEQFREGSIQLLHPGKDLVIGAQIYLTENTHSLSFEEKLTELGKAASTRLEGVWWVPSPKGIVNLVLSNTTDATLSVSTKIRGKAPKAETTSALSLMPHETKVLEINRDLIGRAYGAMSRYGAISIEHNGPAGALLSRAMAFDTPRGYSLPIQFYDPKAAKSTSLQGAGLRVGKAGSERLSPTFVVYNAGERETVLSGRLPYMTLDGIKGEITLPDVQISPGEIQIIDLAHHVTEHGLEDNVAAAGLEFQYTGEPGSVITSAFSVSQNGNQVFRIPLWDIAAQRSATGGYPWYIDGDSSTIVYIKNVTDELQQYTLQVRYDGGVYALGLKTVEPRQTVAVDIRALRDHQIPDESGRRIPQEAARGQINWSMRGPKNQVLIGRSEQVDVAHGISSNYACMNCCPDSFAQGWVDPGSVQGFQGDTSQFNAFEQTRNCYGSLSAPFNPFPSWGSTDWNVASCDGSGFATAEGSGSANIQATWLSYEWGSFESGNPNECYPIERNILAEAICDVFRLPNIKSISQSIIDESSQGAEVVECGRFQVTSKFEVGCPLGPGQGHTYTLTGHIQDDAIELSSSTQEIANDLETCTYENVKTYRMKNRLDQTIGTGFTSYKGVVTWSGMSASKNGPGISVRATIPGTGACP